MLEDNMRELSETELPLVTGGIVINNGADGRFSIDGGRLGIIAILIGLSAETQPSPEPE
jgi:hypothetical protein